jgi:hypothetical protein
VGGGAAKAREAEATEADEHAAAAIVEATMETAMAAQASAPPQVEDQP